MKNKTVFAIVAFFAICLSLLSGCAAAQDPAITETSNGKQIALKAGQPLTVKLESNVTTGYSWEVAGVDATVLKQQGDSQYAQANSNQKIVGAGGWQTFHFTAEKAGSTTLKLIYHRPFEKGVEPIKTFTVQVTVQ